MEKTYYLYAQAGFLLLSVACLGLILWGTSITLRRMDLSRGQVAARTITLGIAFVSWLTAVSIISLSGYFSDFSVTPPRLFPFLLIPLAAVLIITFHPSSKRFLAHVPASWLMHLQVIRVPIELLLWLLFLDGLLPVQMTFEGRNWDILTGLTAPVVAYLCFGRGRHNKWLALVWNLAGFAFLVNIVAIAMLSTPSPFRVFMNEPANTIVTYFPIIFLPTVLVPIAYAMHFFSFRKLWLERRQKKQATPPPAEKPHYRYSVS